MIEALKILYEANNLGIWLWVEGDKLKFKAPKDVDATATLSKLKTCKDGIIEILKTNEVDSNRFIPSFIYHIPNDSSSLSFAQERLWFVEQYSEGTNAYHIPLIFDLDDSTDLKGVEYAFNKIAERHEILRSTVRTETEIGKDFLTIHENPIPIEYKELLTKKELFEQIRVDINKPFDLRTSYPIRVILYTLKSNDPKKKAKRTLLINMHHIASDGWSMDVFDREFLAYSDAYNRGDLEFNLPPLKIQYKDYTFWQGEYLSGEILEEQIGYWRQKLEGYQTLSLPTDYPRPAEVDYSGSIVHFSINKSTTAKLKKMAQDQQATLYSVLLGSLNILMGKYSGQSDILIGSPIANRHLKQTENLIGLFINTLVNRVNLKDDQSFEELIIQVQNDQIELQRYQDLPFEKILEDLNVERDLSRHPVFQVLFSVQSFGGNHTSDNEENQLLEQFDLKDSHQVEKFDLTIYIDDSGDELTGSISYATSLFSEETIERLKKNFTYLLDKLVDNPKKSYNDISLLSEADFKTIVYDWNKTEKEFPQNKSIIQLFEEQVEKNPNNVALSYKGEKLSYTELNSKANQLARHIREVYFQKNKVELAPNTLINLCLDRSLEMIVGILATMKAGGAYVPIDPGFPADRINFIIEDTNADIILTQSSVGLKNIAKTQDQIVVEIDLDSDLFKEKEKSNLQFAIESTDLAYVIYTSGTTGKPKGVMMSHRPFVQFIYNFNDLLAEDLKTEKRNILSLTNYVFDIFGLEYALPLVTGNTVVLSSVEDMETVELDDIQIIQQTPSSLLEVALNYKEKLSGITCLVGGEALPAYVAESLLASFESVYNVYGPAETTIWSSIFKVESANQIYIGKPLSNEQIYIVDKTNNPVPVGVIGELYIGGTGLAEGYLNRASLTEERFINNPFVNAEDDNTIDNRLYKTGDLARWMPDGNIDFIGRNDDQIKIRGYRVELGEIEHALAQVDGIKQACVLAKEHKSKAGNSKYLVGYYTLESQDSKISESEISEKLSRTLPEYMIPSALLELDSFPLTSNGKLNKRALPEIDFSVSEEYMPPTTEMEKSMCEMWQDVLGLDQVGISDDFFKIGGNSILAIRLSSLINVRLKCEIKVRDIFKFRTISQLIKVIEETLGNFALKDYLIKDNTEGEHLPFDLTNVQQAYAFGRLGGFEMSNVSTHSYSELIFSDFNTQRFEDAINVLINRHGALRTIFTNAQQTILEEVPHYTIKHHGAIQENEIQEIRSNLSHKVYDIEQWPLFSFEFGDFNGKTMLFTSIDALIMDATSYNIIFDELMQLYNADDINDVQLKALNISFKDYVEKLNEVRASHLFEDARDYWLKKVDDYSFDAHLPIAVNPSSIEYPKFTRISKLVNKKHWDLIKDKAEQNNFSPTSVILYIFGLVLTKWSGKNKFCINLTLFNRLPLHEEVNDIVGDFTVLELYNFERQSSNQSIRQEILDTHSELWNDIEHNLFDGIDFQRVLRKELGLSKNQILSPVVLTSTLGDDVTDDGLDGFDTANYSITQTPQVYLDNKAYEVSNGFVAEWDFVEQMFEKETINQMHEDYCNLIEKVAELDWSEKLPSLEVSQKDLQIITQANNFDQASSLKTLPELFLPFVESQPLSPAVIDSTGEYSYQQIGDFCFSVAGYLIDNNIAKKNHLIGVLSEKGYQQVAATLGIMHSGGAYLPLNVDWPIGRFDEILVEGKVTSVLVSQKQFDECIKDSIIEDKYDWLIIEEVVKYVSKVKIDNKSKANCEDIAYVIFTSGSTGTPKGVTISHEGAVNTINAVNARFDVNANDKVFALSELSFDLSVYDLFGILAAGGAIVFPDQEKVKNPDHWFDLIKSHTVTIWDSVPQLMQLLVDYTEDTKQDLNCLKVSLLSGDWIPINLPERIKSLSPKSTVMSLGGATEGSIWSIWYEVKSVDLKWNSIPYGHAMPNQKMYVLNNFGDHSPVGVLGEIHIGGDGVALNYWNNLENTEASFFMHPTLGRLYKTGDLGKWHQDGFIEFKGRVDHQVKLNGYRVELDEISSKLMKLEGIDQSIVVLQDNQLVAYFVPESDADERPQSEMDAFLTSKLDEYLPHYMMPSHFIELSELPKTANGKIAYNKLPKAESKKIEYIAPVSEVETELTKIWEDVLGLEKISITDDLFRIGGDSILSIQISIKVRQAGYNCQVRDVLENRTIEKLAVAIVEKQEEDPVETEQGILEGSVGLLPVQEWFIDKVENGQFQKPNHWNQSFLVKVPVLDPKILEEIIPDLLAYHDILRVQYHRENEVNIWEQNYHADFETPNLKTLNVNDFSEQEINDKLTDWQSNFDLENGPLFQLGYLHGYKDNSARLYFALHHMVVDTVSWRILLNDVRALYSGKDLPPKGSSYRQWIQIIKDYPNRFPAERRYWNDKLKDISTLDLNNHSNESHTEIISLDKETTISLIQEALKTYNTEINDLLLTTLAYGLKDLNNKDIHGITLEGHGREELSSTIDHSRTVGWFTSMYPVQLRVLDNLKESIRFNKESLRKTPNKGIGFGAFACESNSEFGFKDLPPISFNYLGQFETQEDAEWQVIIEDSGVNGHLENEDDNLINIISGVSNKKLQFSVTTRLGKEKTLLLANSLKKHLVNIVEHNTEVLEKGEISFTPSDFSTVSISQELLDKLQGG